MATAASLNSDTQKLSFAKVAASATMDNAAGRIQTRAPVVATTPSAQRRDATQPAIATGTVPPMPDAGKPVLVGQHQEPEPPAPILLRKPNHVQGADVAEALAKVTLADNPPSLVVNGSGSASTGPSSKDGISQSPSDEASQKADSNSELGTKPPSSDGKSITSGTTFNALDEKESLRPDDSASVMAAAEDDDSMSIRGSLPAISRMGSDVAPRGVHRIQLGEMPLRPITHVLPGHGVSTPQSGASDQPQVAGMPLADATMPNPMSHLYSKTPDASLIEAMQAPKDRIWLLSLEKQVIEFVQDSKESYMDLPHMNSFFRMLVHKLADYYHMTHSFEALAGGVRIYRTPFCRVPPSLASIALSASASSTPPPVVLPKKIMRRGEDGELAPSSATPSKPASEAGSDKDKPSAPASKQTREEREKAYAEHRERIFGSAAPTETSGTDKDDGTGMSRVSSVSGTKSNVGRTKKTNRQRRDENEGFDSRSAYIQHVGGYGQAQTWVSQQFVPVGNPQYGMQMSQPMPQQQTAFMSQMQSVYQGPAQQQYPQMVASNGYVQPVVTAMPTYPQQSVPARFSPPTGQMTGGYGPQAPPAMPQQNWQQGSYAAMPVQGPAAGQGFGSRIPGPAGQAGQVNAMGVPYQYGQLPVNVNPNDPRSQHPIPGSYAGNGIRHAFNPMTQSFVPGTGPMMGGTAPGPGFVPPNTMPGAVANPAPMMYGGYSQMAPQPMQPQPQQMPVYPMQQPHGAQTMGQVPYAAGPNGGYSMMRQGSNQPMPGFMPSPQTAHQQPKYHGSPHVRPRQVSHHSPANIPAKPVMPQASAPTGPSGQTFSHLPNVGNPASLPPKPTV